MPLDGLTLALRQHPITVKDGRILLLRFLKPRLLILDAIWFIYWFISHRLVGKVEFVPLFLVLVIDVADVALRLVRGFVALVLSGRHILARLRLDSVHHVRWVYLRLDYQFTY